MGKQLKLRKCKLGSKNRKKLPCFFSLPFLFPKQVPKALSNVKGNQNRTKDQHSSHLCHTELKAQEIGGNSLGPLYTMEALKLR